MIGDRLFGTAYTLWQALNAWYGRDITFLVPIRDNIKAEVLQRLADGSALVRVPVREAERKVDNLQLREICATGVALNGKRFKLRLWTTLLDPKRYLDTVRHTAVLPERRARSCPRVLRQPLSS